MASSLLTGRLLNILHLLVGISKIAILVLGILSIAVPHRFFVMVNHIIVESTRMDCRNLKQFG
jgi:hypothetical protein